MKIVFVGFGITPYYRDFLNKLHSVPGIAIENIRPSGVNNNLGEGVYENFSGIDFVDTQLVEIEVPGRQPFNIADFETRPKFKTFQNFSDILEDRRPEIVVVNVAFQEMFVYEKKISNIVKSIGAKIVFHSIPFNLPFFGDALRSSPSPKRLELKSFPLVGRAIKFIGLDVMYAKKVRRRALLRPIYRRCKIFQYPDAHAVYHEQGADIYKSYGVNADSIFVVRNSPNTEALINAADNQGPVDHPLRLLHIGRLVSSKRVDLLIRAVAKLREEEFSRIELIVIGYGPCQDELKSLADELNIQGAIHFVGGVYNTNELARYARESCIYVLAGIGGLSINEAMCFSLPIICSRCDGTEKFLVREGLNGVFFEEGNLEDLSTKIAALLRDYKKLHIMGERSREIIETEINSEVHVNNYLCMFERVTGKPLKRYYKKFVTRDEACARRSL